MKKVIRFLSILPIVFLAVYFEIDPAHASQVHLMDWSDLTDKNISPEAKIALAMGDKPWKHAETEHFVFHFTDESGAETVYLHAEIYYTWIKDFFGVHADEWTKKAHIFIFEDKDVWTRFKDKAGINRSLEAEAFTTGWELFIYRDPFWLSPQKTLAHELTHVIVFRFLDGPIPLFLNEGFAEFISSKAVATQFDGDEYRFHTIQKIAPERFIPLEQLVEMRSYPALDVGIFYRESELLVRFLIQKTKSEDFYLLLHKVSRGELFKKISEEVYSMDFNELKSQFEAFAIAKE